MRQLSSLDAQFLNVESARIYGHVAFLGIYDPTTAPGGNLGGPEIRLLLEQRLHLLPPLKWRLVEVPLGLDLPYWAEDPDFDLEFHIRETALPAPGDDRRGVHRSVQGVRRGRIEIEDQLEQRTSLGRPKATIHRKEQPR